VAREFHGGGAGRDVFVALVPCPCREVHEVVFDGVGGGVKRWLA